VANRSAIIAQPAAGQPEAAPVAGSEVPVQVVGIETGPVRAGDDLLALLDAHLPRLRDGDVVAVASKVVALCQGRVVPDDGRVDRRELVRSEAERYLEDERLERLGVVLTLAGGLLIPNAGVDQSNGDGHLVLWPRDPSGVARRVWEHLRAAGAPRELGVVITDSHVTPLRWGVTGVGLAWCGFEPARDYVGRPDVFGRTMRMTRANLLDGLAASAALVMGEGDERRPLALIRRAGFLTFQDRPPTAEERRRVRIAPEDDLYGPLLGAARWIAGGAGADRTGG
jgi:putative folate metabolism gamma-glutamate ligase